MISAKSVYLSALTPLDAKVGYGKLGLDGDLGYNGTAVAVNEQKFNRSISTHAVENGVASVGFVKLTDCWNLESLSDSRRRKN